MLKFNIPRPSGQTLRTIGLFLGAPIFGGMLAWQLWEIRPERICKTSYEIAKLDGAGLLAAFNACIGLYAKAMDIRDHAVIGLLCILGLGYLMMMMRELRMQGEVTGPLGTGAKFRSEEPEVTTTTTTEVK